MSRLRCFVVTWKQGETFPSEKLNTALTAVFNNHPPSCESVDTEQEGLFAIVVAPRPIAPRVVQQAWVEFLERSETNPVDLQLLTRA